MLRVGRLLLTGLVGTILGGILMLLLQPAGAWLASAAHSGGGDLRTAAGLGGLLTAVGMLGGYWIAWKLLRPWKAEGDD